MMPVTLAEDGRGKETKPMTMKQTPRETKELLAIDVLLSIIAPTDEQKAWQIARWRKLAGLTK